MLSPDQAAAYVTAIVFALAAGYERVRANKRVAKTEGENEALSAAKMQETRAELFQKMAQDNLAALKKENEDHKETRKYWHDKSSEWEATSAKMALQIIELQAKPDYSEMLQVIRDQGKSLTDQGKVLQQILEHLTDLREPSAAARTA